MKLNDLVNQTSEWLRGTGPNSNIVISSRIRLARNLKNFPFSHWANEKQLDEVFSMARKAILANNYMKNALFLKLTDLSKVDKQFLIERHLISHEYTIKPEHKAVAIADKEILSIMINEEDHLRIQVMQSGFNLKEAWSIVNKIDTEPDKKLNYAFSDSLGHLTACPTNTGTGMRASVMLHLPSLVMAKQINKILQAIAKLSLTARGFYGEGTEARGNFFQISNQVTLGHSEEEAVGNIERIIKQVIDHEENARKTLFNQNKEAIADRIWRAYGTLKSAHIITSRETVDLLSLVRLGIDAEVLKNISKESLNELFILTQPAHLQKLENRALSPTERDIKRASLIRSKLK